MKKIAAEFHLSPAMMPKKNVPSVRILRRERSKQLERLPGGAIITLAKQLVPLGLWERGLAYEIIMHHRGAQQVIRPRNVAALGRGIHQATPTQIKLEMVRTGACMKPFLLILVFSLFWSITPTPREAVAGVLGTSSPDAHVDSSRMMHEPDDYLWLVQYPDPRHLSAHFQELIRMLAASRVSSIAAAESAAINYRFRTGAGILAEEYVRVTGLIILARDVAGFANHHDMVWIVRISYQSYKVTQELWVDATSGKIRTMLP